jgi:hypothetical protein
MKYSFLFFLLLGSAFVKAQTNTHLHCGQVEAYNQLYKTHPELEAIEYNRTQHIADLMSKMDLASLKDTRANKIVIPIVFHVLHQYGSEMISDNQIYDQMRILNEDFNKLNADTSVVLAPFKSIIGKTDVEFRLARLDPDGNCTNGIDRIYTHKAFGGDDFSKKNQWSRNYYLNVWVAGTIGQSGVAGYAYKPASAYQIPYYDGIIILHDYIGSIGTGSPAYSRALTHEIGHWLGLDHTWGGTNQPKVACGDDGVFDTPETKGHDACTNADLYDSTSCPSLQLQNTQNFMEYSYCSHMYTQGQSTKMRLSFDDITERGYFLLPNVLSITGTDTVKPLCAPKGDFLARRLFTCPNTNSTINEYSHQAAVSSRVWSATNGTFSNASSAPNLSFNAQGWQDVSLIVNGASGSDTVTKNKYIFVADPTPSHPSNLYQDFEDPAQNDKWPMFNIYNNRWKWEVAQNAGYYTSKCLKFNSYYRPAFPESTQNDVLGDYDEIVSQSYDLSSFVGGACNFNFMSSGANLINAALPDFRDSLVLYYSTNCGNTWVKVAHQNGTNLMNNHVADNVNFTPTSPSQWKANTINIPSIARVNGVFFKLRYYPSAYSSNFYIDNIDITAFPTSIGGTSVLTAPIAVHPNPVTRNSFYVSGNFAKGNQSVVITTITGQKVQPTSVVKTGTEMMEVELPATVANGIYFVTVQQDGVSSTPVKVTIQKD